MNVCSPQIGVTSLGIVRGLVIGPQVGPPGLHP